MEKRGRGRPKGKKDSKPRVFRSKATLDTDGLLTVEERVRALGHPLRISTLAIICGLSEATLRKKIEQGKIKAFKRSGVILVECADFLEYWRGGKAVSPVNPALFTSRMNVSKVPQ